MALKGTKVESDLIQEIRTLRNLSPNDTLVIDTTPVGVLKLMLKFEKLKSKQRNKK
jgi:hypothetical protein